MDKASKIYVAGHKGLVGSAIWNNLLKKGYSNLVGRTIDELNLLDQRAVAEFFAEEKPEYVVLAAAKVGGIIANYTYRGEFIYENLQIQNNVIHQSWLHGVKKLLFLGSTCIYPKQAPQPMPENCLLTSELEYSNEPYAIAKIAGLKLCESYNLQYGTNFIAVMPTNLYGPYDNFDLEKSHVLPALIRKIHLGKCLEEGNWEAIRFDLDKRPVFYDRETERLRDSETKQQSDGAVERFFDTSSGSPLRASQYTDTEAYLSNILLRYGILLNSSKSEKFVSVSVWGTGKPLREFLWVEDMAEGCVFILEHINFNDLIHVNSTGIREIRNTHINIGTGKEISIKDLAYLIKEIIGFKGEIVFDASKPDGTLRKLTDPSKLHALGWHYSIEIEEGIRKLYDWYVSY
jgi:GDP-L-fucose synthase